MSERSQPLRRDHAGEPSSSSHSDRDRRKSPSTLSSPVTGGNCNESDPLQRNRSSRELRDHENGRKRTREEPLDCIPYSALPSTSLSTGKSIEANGRRSVHTGGSSSSNAPQPGRRSDIGRRSAHTSLDITKGTENVKIMLLDKSGKESRPNFTYIPENTVYQNAQIHVSLARIADDNCCSSCSGDCLSYSIPCECARDTGGEFAYTREGLLREDFLKTCISMAMGLEPEKHYHVYCADCPLERAKRVRRPEKCKGHLVRKFIKECWRKCGCSMLCGNRVVQRGITRKLQVFLADEGKGWGLRTVEEIPEGAFVCQYVGEILTNMELYERNQSSSEKGRHTYPVLLDADWGSEGVLKDEEALCLDATYYGNVARFINHRCYDANLLDIPVEVESPDHHYYHLAFFTRRKIEAFEELTWDYKIDFDDYKHPIKAFQCCCKSPYCRDKKGKRALE